MNIKKYTLTIKYDESTDNVEWIEEEVVTEEIITANDLNDISNLTIEDIQLIMKDKDYAKA